MILNFLTNFLLMFIKHLVCTNETGLDFFPFLSFPAAYRLRDTSFAWSTLPLSRANICQYTLKRSKTKAEAEHPRKIWDLLKFVLDKYSLIGIPGALLPTFLPFLALLPRFIDDFYDFFASDFYISVWYRYFTVILLSSILSNDFLHGRGPKYRPSL